MLASFWTDFLTFLSDEKEKNPIIYSLIKQLTPIELTEGKVVVSCDNQGLAYYLQKRAPTVEKYLSAFLKSKTKLQITVKPKRKKEEGPLLKFEPDINDIFRKAGLSGKYKFTNFAVSSTNQVAHAAAQAVADNLGHAYNPLFLYGGVGVGKTHLSQAVAHKCLGKEPKKRVLYCPGEQFTNEIIEAIREGSTAKFRRRYRQLDLLIVDDVQFLAGKNHVQEEFFHTFNALVSLGGQIVLISDRQPDEIKKLEDRLRSRFSGGLIVDIQQPDFELRTAILLIKAQEKNIDLEIELAKIIADQVIDTRSLEGTLLSLYAKTLSNGGKIDLEVVEAFFSAKEKDEESKRKRISPHDVIKTVCSYYNIKLAHLKSSNRSENLALPRQITMFLLRNEFRLKYEEIAHLLRKRDHTTVMHGVEKIERILIKDAVFKQEVDSIVQSLRS